MSTYKTSSLRLYYTSSTSNWELLPHKLFVIDNIEDYLATKSYLVVALFQYQKPQLELSINVDLSQTYAEPLNQSFKYVRIANSDQPSRYYYYFVKNTIWRSKSAVRFDLVLDVLNTFKEGTDYSFKDSTKITREHKDRFIKKNGNELVFDVQLVDYSGFIENQNCDVEDSDGNLICSGTVTSNDQYSVHFTLDNEYDPDEIIETILGLGEDITFRYTVSSFYVYSVNTIISSNALVYRNIDYVQENINPRLQCGDSKGTLIEHGTSNLRQDWYLLYRNVNDPTDSFVNPVECYLIPENEIETDAAYIQNGRLIPSFIEEGKFYYFRLDQNQSATLSNGVSVTTGSTPPAYRLLVTKSGEKMTVVVIREYVSSVDIMSQSDEIDYVTFTNLPINYSKQNSYVVFNYSNISGINYNLSFNNSGTLSKIDDINNLDRTDSRNIKLIKLPYSPYNFTFSGTTLQIDSNWEYVSFSQYNGGDMKALKLKDLNTILSSSWNNYTAVAVSPLYLGNVGTINPDKTDLRKGMNYESKLYNGEFYRPTFVYDSFQFSVELEKCNMFYYMEDISRITKFTIKFDMTRTINSKFMFTFSDYELRNATESYANVMPIARNNEEVLYNVPYINYIRSGYNYDIKAKNVSAASTWIGAGLSLAGVGASLFAPTVPLKVMGVVSSLISMAMTTKNAVVSTVQNEQSIQRKLQEAKMQTASVSGSDDVDLMSVYAENRLKYLIYEPTEIMKNMLYNLFFFAGYSSNRLGLPNHDTRLNFDYLECDAVIDKIGNIPDDCLNELVNCFKNGVTYIHKTNRSSNKWDFEQVYENWEKSLGVN